MGQKQPYRAVHSLLPALILVHHLLLHLTWLADLIIRDLCKRSCLVSELSFEALNHSKHTLTKEGEVEVDISALKLRYSSLS